MLELTNLSMLANHRILLCKKLMADMKDESHSISFLAPKVTTRTMPYQLRSGNTTAPKTMKRTKRANDFLHLDLHECGLIIAFLIVVRLRL